MPDPVPFGFAFVIQKSPSPRAEIPADVSTRIGAKFKTPSDTGRVGPISTEQAPLMMEMTRPIVRRGDETVPTERVTENVWGAARERRPVRCCLVRPTDELGPSRPKTRSRR